MPQSLDQLPAVKTFKSLRPLVADERWRRTGIRLLSVFGVNGKSIIFATDEDRVYGFGDNPSGRLGVDRTSGHYREPRLNPTLSGQQVVDFCHGLNHTLALTAGGRLWAWGENRYGQCGVGTNEDTDRPELIRDLGDKRVAAIACGKFHSLALTTDGQVFGFGRNNMGQLGVRHFVSRLNPTPVRLKGDRIVAIDCGKCHSVALTDYGLVYVWGSNWCYQLGRPLYEGLPSKRHLPVSETPELIPGLDHLVIEKVVCGAEHTLLLTTDGHVYAFGDNTYGQVGNGSQKTQPAPVCITEEIRFKDIFAYSGRSHSIGLSVDNRYYIWGFLNDGSFFYRPELIRETPDKYTVCDIFAIYSKIEITFETIVFKPEPITSDVKTVDPIDTPEDYDIESTTSSDSNINRVESRESVCLPNDSGISVRTSNGNLNITPKDQMLSNGEDDDIESTASSAPNVNGLEGRESVANDSGIHAKTTSGDMNINEDLMAMNEFQKCLSIGFDNPLDYDLEFQFTDKSIYCQKSIIKYRNKTFWEICTKKMLRIKRSKKYDISVKSYTYEAFRAFLQFLYGLKPDINDDIAAEVSHLATIYDESVLKAMCGHALSREMPIDLTNVCHLYEKAINDGSVELEKKCIDFVSTYLIDVCKSDAFHSMPKQLSRRLIQAISE